MPNVSSVNQVYLKNYSDTFAKNAYSYIGRSQSESTLSSVVAQKIISLYIHYPDELSTDEAGTLDVRISPDSANTLGDTIFSCKIKPGETVVPISKKVQPIYLSSAERILARVTTQTGNVTQISYSMSVEELLEI